MFGDDEMAVGFVTYEDQIQTLRSKNLTIEDENEAIKILSQYGYFNLVSGYKNLLKNPTTKNYRDGTTFRDLLAVYQFDEDLRELTLRHLLHIERHIRSVLSYAFCATHGGKQSDYMDESKYDQSTDLKKDMVKTLISQYFSKTLNNSSDHPYIEHYKHDYKDVPLWVLMKALTFGTVSKIYECSTSKVQAAVSKEFEAINESQLRQILEVLTDVRNVCAHNERLFTYRCSKHSIPDLGLHKKMIVPRKGNTYTCGKKDYFAVIISLRYLLPHDEFITYKKNLTKLIENLFKQTQGISEVDLFKMMGFPSNWKNIARYHK